jgi:mitotic spindle assembly checkpoint protein MAD1
LRRREAELADLETELQAEQAKVEELRLSLEAVADKARRLENRADLAERDVGFLKAMVVRSLAFI